MTSHNVFITGGIGYIGQRLIPLLARPLGLANFRQMLAALIGAVENPPTGIRALEVPEIRRFPPVE